MKLGWIAGLEKSERVRERDRNRDLAKRVTRG